MPKNTKKSKNKKNGQDIKRELIIAEPGQEYAVCTKVLGQKRFTLTFHDGSERLGVLAGRVKKRSDCWVVSGTWVLCSIRAYQDSKCDIFHVYQKDEVSKLSKMNELDKTLGNKGTGETEVGRIDFEREEEGCAFSIDEI